MFWFAPMWLLCVLHGADKFAVPVFWKSVSFVALGFSVLSAAIPAANPWTSPWIYQYWQYLGWIQ